MGGIKEGLSGNSADHVFSHPGVALNEDSASFKQREREKGKVFETTGKRKWGT